MTIHDLSQTAAELEAQIKSASDRRRLHLQPQLHRVLSALAAQGAAIPPRLRRLDRVLLDEKVEAQFDNMPV